MEHNTEFHKIGDDPVSVILDVIEQYGDQIGQDQKANMEVSGVILDAISSGHVSLEHLPILAVSGIDAKMIGDAISTCYKNYSKNGYPPPQVVGGYFMRQMGFSPKSSFYMAVEKIGKDGEQWFDNAYHNSAHTIEVAMNAMILSHLSLDYGDFEVDNVDNAKLLIAALVHDMKHDGTSNNGVPFRLEKISASIAREAMESVSLTEDDILDVNALVLATEPLLRGKIAELSNSVLDGDDVSEFELPEELSRLKENPKLAVLAGILSDADILCSAGLSLDRNLFQTSNLEKEWGRKLTVKDSKFFFDNIVGKRMASIGGDLFWPNISNIRKASLGEGFAKLDLKTISEGNEIVHIPVLTVSHIKDAIQKFKRNGIEVYSIDYIDNGGITVVFDDFSKIDVRKNGMIAFYEKFESGWKVSRNPMDGPAVIDTVEGTEKYFLHGRQMKEDEVSFAKTYGNDNGLKM